MKNYKTFLFIAAAACAAFSCSEKEEASTDITYLGAGKTSGIVYGETVSFHASSQGATFQWTCSGGSLQGEGKSVTWIAPNAVGKYTVSVSNGNGSTQSKELEVVGTYFWGFDKASADWAYDGEHTTRTFSNGKLRVSSSSATASGMYSYKTVGTALPYSVKTQVAVNRTNESIAGNTASFYFYFVPAEGSTLRNIRFRVTPDQRVWSVAIGRIDDVSGDTKYTTIQSPQTKDIFAAADQFHAIGVAISADKTFIVNLDGEELYRTNALASDINTLAPDKFSYVIQPTLTMVVDDFCFVNDGTILK